MVRRSARELRDFGEGLALLTAASIAIRLLPFRALVHLMGRTDPAAGASIPNPVEVRRAVKRASRRLPWRTLCFQEGLAAHWMLRRRGLPSRLHYGIRHRPDRLTAHVWVELAGKIVIGEEEPGAAHLPVAVYPATGRALPNSSPSG